MDTNFNSLSPASGNTNLFVKTGAGDEHGLGLTADSDHEISGTQAVQIALPHVFSSFSFQMGSSTGTEGWRVWGSNDPTVHGPLLLTGTDELNIFSQPREPFFNSTLLRSMALLLQAILTCS